MCHLHLFFSRPDLNFNFFTHRNLLSSCIKMLIFIILTLTCLWCLHCCCHFDHSSQVFLESLSFYFAAALFEDCHPMMVIKLKFSSFFLSLKIYCIFSLKISVKLEKIFLFSSFSSEFLNNWVNSKIKRKSIKAKFFPLWKEVFFTSLMNESVLSTVSS